MEMGIIGLGRMGMNMSTRLVRDGHRVVAFNRTKSKLVEPAMTIEEMVGKLRLPRVVWVMVPAGEVTDAMLEASAAAMAPGDVLIDGGNSNFKDSQRRAADYTGRGFHYLDAGTSGGIWG